MTRLRAESDPRDLEEVVPPCTATCLLRLSLMAASFSAVAVVVWLGLSIFLH